MGNEANREWGSIPCESDAWPYSPAVYETRRAVGQSARCFDGLFAGERGIDSVLLCVYAALLLETTVKDVLRDLGAEAQARAVTWKNVGGVMGTTFAAPKRFGGGLSDERRDELQDELAYFALAKTFATVEHDVSSGLAAELGEPRR